MKEILVQNKRIGEKNPCFIIAEGGVNHNGDVSLAKRLIDDAAAAEADAIKFQTFITEEGIIKNTPKAAYQKNPLIPDEDQFQMIKKLELSESDWFELSDYAKGYDIVFFSKPSHESAVDLLLKMKVPLMKISSGDITFHSLIEKVSKTMLPTIMSTGMSTMAEIDEAFHTFISTGNNDLILMHCTSYYPAPYNELNLNVIKTLKCAFNTLVGYSDHSLGIHIPVAAVTMGACSIEKHFTCDKKLPGPDHKASLEPKEFHHMVTNIRDIEFSLGDGIKNFTKSEVEMRRVARKSLVASQDLPMGKILEQKDFKYKRPGTGISQKYMKFLLKRKLKQDLKKDEIFSWDMI